MAAWRAAVEWDGRRLRRNGRSRRHGRRTPRRPTPNCSTIGTSAPMAPRSPIRATASLTAFGNEFKRLPVRMQLWMDQRWLPQLISECANAPLQVEVQEVRINPADDGSGGGGGGRGGGGYGRGEGGGYGGRSHRERRDDARARTEHEDRRAAGHGLHFQSADGSSAARRPTPRWRRPAGNNAGTSDSNQWR